MTTKSKARKGKSKFQEAAEQEARTPKRRRGATLKELAQESVDSTAATPDVETRERHAQLPAKPKRKRRANRTSRVASMLPAPTDETTPDEAPAASDNSDATFTLLTPSGVDQVCAPPSGKKSMRARARHADQTAAELAGMLANGVDATPAPVKVSEEQESLAPRALPTAGPSSAPTAPTSRRGGKGRAQAQPDAKVPAGRRDPRVPATGTELVRVFRGKEHRVIVRDDGFEYRGELHRSLSSIACSITGASWNGFSFFGLLR